MSYIVEYVQVGKSKSEMDFLTYKEAKIFLDMILRHPAVYSEMRIVDKG